MSKQTNNEEIREWEEEFNEKFGKAGPEMNCDSIGRPAGCDDCVVNIKLREEYKNFIKKVEDQTKANLKAKVMALTVKECEKMYPEFLDRNCNDLLTILSGNIQIALLEQDPIII